jgi:hypothetical protein
VDLSSRLGKTQVVTEATPLANQAGNDDNNNNNNKYACNGLWNS